MGSFANQSKEEVKQQILNELTPLWGVNSVDDLDPIVLILIEGLASEIYTVNQNLQDSQLRILESIASLLTPSAFSFPKPAHAVATMESIDPYFFINKQTELEIKKLPQEIESYGINSLTFTPIADTRLVAGKIKYLICERKLYRTEANHAKTLLTNATQLDERINHTVWVGMQISGDLETLKDVSFYIDFPRTAAKYEKYSLLPYSKWSYKGQPIEMAQGLPVWHKKEEQVSIFDKYELLNEVDSHILSLYDIQFQTIKSNLPVADLVLEHLPTDLADAFPEETIEKHKIEPCVWIKITFPPHLLVENLYDLTICLNAFPVANKIPYSTIHAAQGKAAVIPLRTHRHHYFLSVEQTSDSYGTPYTAIPYASDYGKETGVYTLKQGGMERFDVRSAKTYIERMIDLLRTEKMAFSSTDMDNLRNAVKKLGDDLTQIENQYNLIRMDGLGIPYYVLANTFKPDERIFIDYWATNAELANGIRSGRTLTPVKSIPIVNESCKLLKLTTGGKSAPTPTQKVDAYRYAISSHDLLFTNENIANFLKMELGEKIKHIEVKRGVAVSSKPAEGLIRTLDIHLTATPGYLEILQQMETELFAILYSKSPDTYNYRIFYK